MKPFMRRPSCRLTNELTGDRPELGSFNETDLICFLSHESRLIGTKPPWWYDVDLKVFIFLNVPPIVTFL